MNTIYVTYAVGPYVQEFDLIERLCKYEGYTVAVVYPENPDFKRYYNEKKQLRQELWETAMHKIDAEAEFTALYVDDVVNRLTNP